MLKYLLFIFCCLIVVSCAIEDEHTFPYIENGGVAISFDDQNVNGWFHANEILSKYSWKASFCVSHIDELTDQEKDQLLFLQSEGHEIASHGLRHINAFIYTRSHSIEEYINVEIIPSISIMKNIGFEVNSFAYPYGARTSKIDEALFGYFNILRGVTTDRRRAFFKGSRIIYAFEMGNQNINKLFELLEHAKNNGQLLLLYGHQPNLEMLDEICHYVSANNMEYLTLNDLNRYTHR